MSHSHNFQHFTGTKGGKRVRRKGKGLNRKQRKKKQGSHENKYGHMAPKKSAQTAYSKEDKTLRDQPLQGKPGKTIKAGFVVLFHGRRYALIEDTVIPESGRAYGRFRLQTTLS